MKRYTATLVAMALAGCGLGGPAAARVHHHHPVPAQSGPQSAPPTAAEDPANPWAADADHPAEVLPSEATPPLTGQAKLLLGGLAVTVGGLGLLGFALLKRR